MRVGDRVAKWAQWHCLLGILVLVYLFGVTATTHAANFYWYGANPDCWQTGALGSSGEACDSGGGVISAGGTGDLNVAQSGDYCNTYNVSNTICNDEGTTWPLSFKYTTACAHDSPACGIQHYASFAGQNDQPWGSWGSSPQLVFSSELAMTSVTAPYNAWAYLCAMLQAPGTKLYLEDCFDRWQGSATQENLPAPPFASTSYGRGGICGGVIVNGESGADDQVVTAFAPNAPTPFGTTIAGTTITGGTTGTNHFQATISTTNLANAIARDNQAPPTGCSRGLPTNVGEYRLVGVQDGIEGGVHTQLAATTSHLRAWTEYTPLPPEATTSAPSAIQETQAKLNGTVNPKGTDTHYYFQYGTTVSYGGTTPETDAGSGQKPVAASATVSGLEPGLTYHYRIVTHSQGGTSYGGDKTVTIPAPMVAFQANTGELFTYSATTGVVNTTEGIWPGTNPSIAGLATGGYATAFNANTGELFTDLTTGGVVNTTEGLKVGTNPSVAALPNGSYVVAFQANTGELFTYSPTTGVVNTTEGMKPETSPSVAVLANGSYVVAFTANTGELFIYSPATGVVNTTEGMWPGTSPSVTGLAGGGYVIAFNANTGELFTDSTTSGVVNTTEGLKKGTSPSVAGLANGGYIVAFNANTGELFTDSSTTGVVNTTEGMWPGTSPSITGLPGGGYVIAFNANTGELFTDSTTSGVVNTAEGLKIGTSPSITR